MAHRLVIPVHTVHSVHSVQNSERNGRCEKGSAPYLLVSAPAGPSFWVGPILILIFSVHLDWFPVSGMEEPRSVVLPSIALGTALAAILTRMIRASLVEEISSPYCLAASAKGLGKWKVVLRHSLKNAFVPVVTVLGLQAGVLLTGAVITETVFGWPGLGLLAFESLFARDLNLLLGIFAFSACLVVAINLSVDIIYTFLDPRIEVR